MARYRIAVIPGDGAGPEVVDEGLKVLDAVSKSLGVGFDFTSFPWGTEHYLKHGRLMPEEGPESLKAFDAIYFGAVGDPRVPDHITLHGLILPLRRAFDLYINERPAYLYEGVSSPLSGKRAGEIDMVVIRENTEGEYSDVGGNLFQDTENEISIQTAVFTRRGIERVMRYAFRLAQGRGRRKKVTSITKSNAQRYGMVLWDRVFREVAAEFPGVETNSYLVDAAAMNMVRRPEEFDVVVASNLFGDILTDLSAIIVGGMGLAPSGNIRPEKDFPSMFEPIHGSAPDIAGKGIANPLGAILSAGMMMRHLGEGKAADLVEGAVKSVLAEGKVRTPDLGGRSKTAQVGDAVVRLIEGISS